jgi:DNA-binding CsgD family transcriptional regulator
MSRAGLEKAGLKWRKAGRKAGPDKTGARPGAKPGASGTLMALPGRDSLSGSVLFSRVPWSDPMKLHILIYGVVGGLLVALLQWTQYRFLVLEHSTEIYAGLIAAVFAGVGIWLGLKLRGARERIVVQEVQVAAPEARSDAAPAGITPEVGARFHLDEKRQRELGITRRELEVLELIAQGMSNREIAEKLFVSENTVKTHSSRVFDKLGAKRRTQAVQFGKEFGLLPGTSPPKG